jgi:hypothetical protein
LFGWFAAGTRRGLLMGNIGGPEPATAGPILVAA